jgi:hypothetical protein
MATIKKAQKGKTVSKSTPTYKNLKMGVRNEQYEMTGQYKDVTPTSLDSANYRRGYERGLKGGKEYPNERNVEKMGRWEGQNAYKKSAKPKSKTGITMKKAQAGKKVGTMPPVTVNSSTMNRGKKTVQTSPGGAYKLKTTVGPSGDTTRLVERRTLKGLFQGAPKARGVMKQTFKSGGKMKKK